MTPMPLALCWILSWLLIHTAEKHKWCSRDWWHTISSKRGFISQVGGKATEWARPVSLSRAWPKGHRCFPTPWCAGSGPQSSLQPAGTGQPLAQGKGQPFHGQGQWRGGVPISYSSYEKPPGNLLPKRITELRCGLASPLLTHTVAMVWSHSCACSIPWQGREGQTRCITRPFPQLDRLNVSSVWSNGKEKKKEEKESTSAALTVDITTALRAHLRPRALLTADCCLCRDYPSHHRTARVIYVVPPN